MSGDRAVMEESPRPARLTPRQRDVLRLVALGHTSREIAEILGISHRTVEMHRANGMRELKARGLPDVVRWARENGLFRPDDA
jgi:two-component system secretion response regulator SsrB